MRAAYILIGLVFLAPAQATADPMRDAVLAGAARCESIPDNRTWLDCFYGSAQPMRSLLGLPPAPAAQVQLVPSPILTPVRRPAPAPVTAARPKEDGFFASLIGSTKPVVSDMPMADYRFASNRTFTVTLKNGDVYQQKEADLVFAKWTKAPASYRVTITAAADDYVLKVKGEPGISFHVRRK